MKKTFIILAVLALSVSCSDKIYVADDVASVFYLKHSGLTEIPLDRQSPEFDIAILKSGHNEESFEISLRTDPELIVEYNAETKSAFKPLPDNCYEVETGTVTFDGQTNCKTVKVTVIPEYFPSGGKFLLPVCVSCSEHPETVSTDMGSVLYHITIE